MDKSLDDQDFWRLAAAISAAGFAASPLNLHTTTVARHAAAVADQLLAEFHKRIEEQEVDDTRH